MRLDRDNFETYMFFLGDNYGVTIKQSTMVLYYEMLSDIPLVNFKVGIKKVIQTVSFKSLPTVADIRNACLGKKSDTSRLAWSLVCDCLGSQGCSKTIAFEDKTIHMAVQKMGGWHSMCKTRTNQMESLKRDFMRYYEDFMDSPVATGIQFEGMYDSRLTVIKCDYTSRNQPLYLNKLEC